MDFRSKIIEIYPELAEQDFNFWVDVVVLQDDSDGSGPYIARWGYEKPQPTKEQLDAITD